MTRRTSRWIGLLAALTLSLVSRAIAAEPPASAPSEPSAETREKMAAIHQKMAECLRSDRPVSDCRAAMRQSCHDAMGHDGCPMMGWKDDGMGPGMRGPGMMKGHPAPETPES